MVGYKQGSGKATFAFQIILASGLEGGRAAGKPVGRRPVRRRPQQLSIWKMARARTMVRREKGTDEIINRM